MLRNFNVAFCHRLTDATLELLSSFAFLLEHLDVSSLPLLTDRGLGCLTGKLTKLRSLGACTISFFPSF